MAKFNDQSSDKFNDRIITNDKIIALAAVIKKKKELRDIDDVFVKKELEDYLNKNPLLLKKLENKLSPRSSSYKQIIKEVRAVLRRAYGLFRSDEDIIVRDESIEALVQKKHLDHQALEKVLSTHSSTKERLSFYSLLYQHIFKITGMPKTILDLGSGLNPFSIPLMDLHDLHYHAYDLDCEEIRQLGVFFRWLRKIKKGFSGSVEVLDILDFDKVRALPKADIVFLFKMTDVLDRGKGHKQTEEVLKTVPAKFVVISFPTLTMSGKKMNFPRRKWIELLCERLGDPFKVLEFSNEIFYIINKQVCA